MFLKYDAALTINKVEGDCAKHCQAAFSLCVLQTFVECVRLRTFGRYGLQQIQVDTHYLQLYLWRFVSDEK